ncbi:hypothetical protein [Polycladospora coralii]|nr:hypothetical protein [Polycladospora coralii]
MKEIVITAITILGHVWIVYLQLRFTLLERMLTKSSEEEGQQE